MPSSDRRADRPGYRLRAARADDLEFVFRVKRETMREHVAATWGWDEAAQREISRRRFEAGGTEILLVGDTPVGYLRVERTEDEIRLLTVFVLADWQSRGIGSAVVDDLLREADDTGRPVGLRVLRVNERARRFYERFGFTTVETTDTHHVMTRPAR